MGRFLLTVPEPEASGLPLLSSVSLSFFVIGSNLRDEAVSSVGDVSSELEPEPVLASAPALLEDIVRYDLLHEGCKGADRGRK